MMQNYFDQFDEQPQPQRIQVRPADPTIADKGRITRNQADASDYDPARSAAQNEQIRLQNEKARLEIEAAKEKAASSEAVNKDLDARRSKLAAIQTAAEQLVAVQKLYNDDFRGGLWNFIEGRVKPSEADGLNKAAAGLLDAGQAAFRIPGSGDQNAQELQFKLDAYMPSATGTDRGNDQNFQYLQTRINNELKAMGEPTIDFNSLILDQGLMNVGGEAPATAPSAAAPVALPRAQGAQGDNDKRDIVAAGQGYKREGRLAGVGQQLLKMVQEGRSREEVMNFADSSFQSVGYPGIFPEQRRALDYAIQMRAANPNKPVTNFVTGWDNYDLVPGDDSRAAQLMGGIATSKVADIPVGNALLHATNAAAMGLPTMMGGDHAKDVIQTSRETMPISSVVGDIGGTAAALVGMSGVGSAVGGATNKILNGAHGLGRDVLYSGARGGIENGPEGAIYGAGAGLIGNRVGVKGTELLGTAIGGVRDPAVRYLADRGIPMTAGQVLGNRGIFGKTMNKLESLPLVGDSLAARRAESLEAFNAAALQDAGSAIGHTPVGTGYAATEAGKKAAGDFMEQSVAGLNVPIDDAGNKALQEALRLGQQLPPDFASKFATAIQNKVAPAIQGGHLTGDGYMQATRGLRSYQAEHVKPGHEADYRSALQRAQDVLSGIMERGAGSDIAVNLQKGRTAYRDYSLLDSAVSRAQAGSQSQIPEIFTPAQLQAVARGSKFAQSGTRAPFYQLSKSGQEVLPSTIPNSHSIDRGLAAYMLPAFLTGGGVAAGATLDPSTAAPLLALAALSTKTGAKVAQKALTGRSPAAIATGRKLLKQRRKTGLFGTATTSAMVPQLTE